MAEKKPAEAAEGRSEAAEAAGETAQLRPREKKLRGLLPARRARAAAGPRPLPAAPKDAPAQDAPPEAEAPEVPDADAEAPEEAPLPDRPRYARLRLAAAVLATAVVVAGALLVFLNRDRLTGDNLRSTLRGDSVSVRRGDAFTYEVGTGQVFALAGNSLAVCSSSAAELLSSAGTTVYKQVVSFGTPAVFTAGDNALFCDLGGTGCLLANLNGEGRSVTPEGALLTASINDSGYYVLVTEQAGYKALVTVYDSAGTARFQWWSGSGYVLKAAVASDNRTLAVLCAENGGGKLHLLRLDSEEEQAEAAFPGELPYDFGFLSGDTVCLLSQEAVSFIGLDGTAKSRYPLEGEYLLDYDLGSRNFLTIYVGPYRSGGSGTLRTLDREGKELGETELEQGLISLSASGRQLLILTGGGFQVCSQTLDRQWGVEALTTAKQALLRPDGDVLLLSAYAAERVRK